MKLLALSSLILVALGCSDPTAPTSIVPGARVMHYVPLVYKDWYAQDTLCAGTRDRHSAYEKIRFYVADSVVVGGVSYWGYWTPDHVITIQRDHVNDEYLVRHELLHDVLNTGKHPATYFVDRCQVSYAGET